MIEARFFIHTCETYVGEGGMNANVTMKACTRKDADNVSWTQWTPSGEFTMTVMNPAAAEFFHEHVGQDVRIHIKLDGERVYGGPYVTEVEQDHVDEAAAARGAADEPETA